jgi:hypothetical protein
MKAASPEPNYRSCLTAAVIALSGAALLAYGYARTHTRTASAWDVFTSSHLDPSTPDRQNGLRLVQIARLASRAEPSRAEQADTINDPAGESVGLFVELPDAPSLSPVASDNCGFQDAGCANLVTLTARTPGGSAIALPWRFLEPTGRKFLFSRIPSGYASGTAYVDVTLRDWAGRQAVWRITNLPHTDRIEMPPVQTDASRDGISVHGTAGVATPVDPVTGTRTQALAVDLAVSSDNRARRIMECAVTAIVPQWRPAGDAPFVTMPPSQSPMAVSRWRFTHTADVAWPAENRLARVSGRAAMYDYYDEEALFHDVTVKIEEADNGGGPVGHLIVRRAQTIQTPSGVAVTLPAQDRPNPCGEGISFDLAYDRNTQVMLPDSPLYKRRSQPIDRIVAAFSPPLTPDREFDSATSGQTTVVVQWPGAREGWLADFPISFRQEVQTGCVPFDLILPVDPVFDGDIGGIRRPEKKGR